MAYACPSCGTDYSRKLARLEALPSRVRCHRCGTVWDPSPAVADAPPPPATTTTTLAEPMPPVLATAPKPPEVRPVPPRRRARLGTVLWVLTALLLVAAGGGLGYAFRDHLPFFGRPLPVLAEVQPVWTEIDGRLQLQVSARVLNPANTPTAVDRVRVKFLSQLGAWIGEVTVTLPPTAVAATGDAPMAFTVDRVPEGTATLEFVVMPVEHGAP